MVRHNIVLLPLLLLLTILAVLITTSAYAKSKNPGNKLTVSISKSDKQWGQYLRATLSYQGPELLENIDLQPWRQLVAITYEDEYIDEDENGNFIQIVQLRLHPRGTGTFQLPALKLRTAKSQPLNINISQAVVKNAPVKLDWQISTLSPWQREAVIVRVQAQTPDHAALIKLDAPAHQDFISRPLKTERQSLDDGSYRYKTGWILYPIKNGLLTLDLPPVRYQLSGSD